MVKSFFTFQKYIYFTTATFHIYIYIYIYILTFLITEQYREILTHITKITYLIIRSLWLNVN